MTNTTRFTLIALVLLMGVISLGLLAGCDEHRVRYRRHDRHDLDRGGYYDSAPRRYSRGFRPPPPRPIRYRGEDRDDFEDRMDDWEDDYDDWKDDYEDWQEDRRDDYEDRYDD
jgi:hypothetical protein